jgi:tRNA (adenine37-N6)-methyltransferase
VRCEMRSIGTVRGGRSEVSDDEWASVRSRIELDSAVVDPSATAGLNEFSHVEVVFQFDRVVESEVCRGARHPRGREDWPLVGILAQRAKDRPNRIGTTVCRLHDAGPLWIEVSGLDAVDGTPVLDVKPFMVGFRPRGEVREPPWATELMEGYW